MRDSSPMVSSETSPDTRRRSSDAKQRKNGMVIIRHKSLCLAREAIHHKTDALGDLRHIRNDLLHHHLMARQSLLAITGTLYRLFMNLCDPNLIPQTPSEVSCPELQCSPEDAAFAVDSALRAASTAVLARVSNTS